MQSDSTKQRRGTLMSQTCIRGLCLPPSIKSKLVDISMNHSKVQNDISVAGTTPTAPNFMTTMQPR